MNSLNYTLKFTLFCAVLMVPLATAVTLLFSEISASSAFATQERLGVSFLRPTVAALNASAALRIAAPSQQPQQLERLQNALDILTLNQGGVKATLHLESEFEALVQLRSRLQNEALDGYSAAAQVSEALEALVRRVGDTSNLILDPDLDSYYLMDATLLRLTVDTRGISEAAALAQQSRPSSQDRTTLTVLVGGLRSGQLTTRRNYRVALDNTRSSTLRPAVVPALKSYETAIERFLDALEPQSVAPTAGVKALATDSLESLSALWTVSADQLDLLIETRIQGRERQHGLVIWVIVLALLVAVYLWVGFLQGTYRTLGTLSNAAKRLASGEEAEKVEAEARDELGRAVNSFNAVARVLVTESKRRQAVLDNVADGILTLQGTRVESANKAAERLFGRPSSDLVGRALGELLPADDGSPASDETVRRALDQSRFGGAWARREDHAQRLDGRMFPVEITLSEMRLAQAQGDSAPGEAHFIAIVRDITERKQAEAEVEAARDAALEASRAKSTFLANMSHELRTPLNAIIGYSEMIFEEAEEEQNEHLSGDAAKIRSAGKHLLGVINDVLDLSKVEAGKMELYVETVDPARLMTETLALARPLAEGRGNVLRLELDPHLGSARLDLTKVRQILLNLLSNAAKFTEGGRILCTAKRERAPGGDLLVFTVRDTGIGMSLEQSGRLFQAFSQADASTTRKYGGTGLGLAISRHFARMMGGDITVESEEGQGTAFTLSLPAEVIPPEASYTPANVAPSVVAPVGQHTVLVIDDEDSSREVVSRALARDGLSMVLAASGSEGLRLASSLRPELILLDVMMPDMDGWAVLTALKADPVLCEIPVVMLTIVSEKALGFALGASEYLTKPVDRDRLLEVVRRLGSFPELVAHDPRSILIVEDDPAIREMTRRTLEREGFVVIEAENGRVALERLELGRPALILLDLMMPEMDGFQFVRALNKLGALRPELADIPIVVITAKDLSSDDRTALDGAVQSILQKGAFEREALIAELRSMVDTRLSALTRPAGP